MLNNNIWCFYLQWSWITSLVTFCHYGLFSISFLIAYPHYYYIQGNNTCIWLTNYVFKSNISTPSLPHPLCLLPPNQIYLKEKKNLKKYWNTKKNCLKWQVSHSTPNIEVSKQHNYWYSNWWWNKLPVYFLFSSYNINQATIHGTLQVQNSTMFNTYSLLFSILLFELFKWFVSGYL